MFFGPQMIKRSLAIASLAVLAGCQGLPQMEDWSNVPEPKQVEVNQVQYSHAVSFMPASDALSAGEGERLLAFLGNAGATRKDVFHVISGSPEIPTGLSDARKVALTGYLSALGVQIRPLSGDFAVKVPHGDTVSLIVRQYVVTLPGCPDWSGDRFTYNNVPTSNWGCATATNLGLMVAEPGDLVRGRDGGLGDGEYAATSISNYRKGETRPLNPEDIGIIESQQNSGEGQ